MRKWDTAARAAAEEPGCQKSGVAPGNPELFNPSLPHDSGGILGACLCSRAAVPGARSWENTREKFPAASKYPARSAFLVQGCSEALLAVPGIRTSLDS